MEKIKELYEKDRGISNKLVEIEGSLDNLNNKKKVLREKLKNGKKGHSHLSERANSEALG